MVNKKLFSMLGIGLALAAGGVAAAEGEILVGSEQNSVMQVSIYNNNLAFVKDTRNVTLGQGANSIAFEGVAAQMRPETALLLGDGIRVVEQNYDYDLLDANNLLESSIGETVKTALYNEQTGQTTFGKAKVLNSNYGSPVLQFSYGVETNFPGRIVYEKLPANLRVKPTLVINLDSVSAGSKPLELAYLTNGLSWKADYVADLKADNKLALNGWITLNNESGTDYKNAEVQLIAGSINQVAAPRPVMARMMKAAGAVMDSFAVNESASMPASEAFADYYLYTLPVKTTLKDKQTKQVSLLSRENVSFGKEYRLVSPLYIGVNARQNEFKKANPEVIIKLNNRQEDNLGIALPEGTVRFYENDSRGDVQFIGESRLEQLAKGEEAELQIGKAFDVYAAGKVTDVRKISKDVSEADLEITFNNVKAEAVEVKFEQNFSNSWEILSESLQSAKKNADTAVWTLQLPADGKTVLKFKVRVSRNPS